MRAFNTALARQMAPRKRTFTSAEDIIEEVRQEIFGQRATLTNKQLALQAHVSPTTISNLMSGKTRWPRPTTLFPVLDALDLEMRITRKGGAR